MLNTSMLQSRQHLTLSEAQEISIKPLRGNNYPNTLMSSEHFEYHFISTHILKILTFVETFWVIFVLKNGNLTFPCRLGM